MAALPCRPSFRAWAGLHLSGRLHKSVYIYIYIYICNCGMCLYRWRPAQALQVGVQGKSCHCHLLSSTFWTKKLPELKTATCTPVDLQAKRCAGQDDNLPTKPLLQISDKLQIIRLGCLQTGAGQLRRWRWMCRAKLPAPSPWPMTAIGAYPTWRSRSSSTRATWMPSSMRFVSPATKNCIPWEIHERLFSNQKRGCTPQAENALARTLKTNCWTTLFSTLQSAVL